MGESLCVSPELFYRHRQGAAVCLQKALVLGSSLTDLAKMVYLEMLSGVSGKYSGVHLTLCCLFMPYPKPTVKVILPRSFLSVF